MWTEICFNDHCLEMLFAFEVCSNLQPTDSVLFFPSPTLLAKNAIAIRQKIFVTELISLNIS